MAGDQSDDGIPLIELHSSSSRNVRGGRDCLTAKAGHGGDGDDGLAPAAIFVSQHVLLETPPVFVPLQGNWIEPWFRKLKHSPYTILIVTLIAITGHSPIAITTFMVVTTMWLHFCQLDDGYQQPHLDWAWFDFGKTFATAIVVCIIAPLLALPIFDITLVVNNDITIGNTTYATMLSWSRVAAYLNGSFPSVMDSEKARSPPNPWAAITQTKWNSPTMPETMTFPLKNNGRGIFEGWSIREDAYGVYMPILAWDEPNPFPDNVLERDLDATTQVLAVRLDCQFVNISSPSLQNSSNGDVILSVLLQDEDSCAAQIDLKGLRLETDMYGLLEEVSSFNDNGMADYADLLKFYSDLGRNASSVIVYTPAWSRLSSSDAYVNERLCPTRLGMVGLSRPLQPEGVIPSVTVFEAAVCKPEFMVTDLILTFRKGRATQFHGPVSMKSQGAYLGRMTPPNLQNLVSSLMNLENNQSAQLREALVADAAEFPALGSRWAWPVIEAGLRDFLHNRRRRIGSLLLAGSLICQSFVAKLAAAAELTLREQMANPGPDMQIRVAAERATAQVERQVFQDRNSFRILKWLSFSLLCLAVLCTVLFVDPRQNRATRDDSSPANVKYKTNEASISDQGRIPWSLSSPIARAMLLRHSSVCSWLRALQAGRYQLDQLPTMRIGDWKIHERAGKSGWRLDSVNLLVSRISNSQKTPEYDPQLGSDILANMKLKQLGIVASIASVSYFVLQGVTISLGRRYEKLDDMAELWRVLGYADLEVDVSFWYILLLYLIPRSLIFYCAMFWLPSVYRFLCSRQAWSSMLHKMQPSHRSITLDYTIQWFPFAYAIRNKHWFIAVLSVSTLATFFVPALQSRMLGIARVRDWLSAAKFVAGSHFEWAESPDSTLETDTFDKALGDLARSSLFSHDVSHWSASEASVLPLDLQFLEFGILRYGYINTPALFANLECEEVTIASIQHNNGNNSEYNQGAEVFVYVDGNVSPTVRVPLPCSIPAETSLQSATTQQVLCMRWWLYTSSQAPSQPHWLLVMANGTGTWSASRHSLQFFESPSVIGIKCRSILRKKQAFALIPTYLTRKDGIEATTSPIMYELQGDWSVVDERIVAALNYGLNYSNMALNGVDGGVIAPDPLLHTDSFAGDFLSWILYQQVFAACPACRNVDSLRHSASRVYSAFIAALVDQRGTPSVLAKLSTIPMEVYLWSFNVESKKDIDWGAAALQFIFALFCMGVVYVIFLTHRQYTLPLSPEPLLNSLILLINSSIISRLEIEFPHPEDLSLKDIYNRINSWGLQCTLNPNIDGALMALSTESVDVLDEGSIQEEYSVNTLIYKDHEEGIEDI